MNNAIEEVSDFFSEHIEEIEEKIAVRERYIVNCRKKIGQNSNFLFIVTIFRERRLKISIDKTEKTLEFLNVRLKEMSFAKEMLTNGNYEPAILLFEQILKKWPSDFINKYLSSCWCIDVKRMKDRLIVLAKEEKTSPLIS